MFEIRIIFIIIEHHQHNRKKRVVNVINDIPRGSHIFNDNLLIIKGANVIAKLFSFHKKMFRKPTCFNRGRNDLLFFKSVYSILS